MGIKLRNTNSWQMIPDALLKAIQLKMEAPLREAQTEYYKAKADDINLLYKDPSLINQLASDFDLDNQEDEGEALKKHMALLKIRKKFGYFSPNQNVNIPEGMKITGYDQKGNPMFREIPKSISEKTQEKQIAEANVKRQTLNKDLESFFAIDDILQQARGEGVERLKAGANMTLEGFTQNTPLGRAVATHDAATKRLRVQLVRAAGDVGNINVVEQEAAEKLIPTRFDDAQTAELKRAYLKQVAQAINNNDANLVKETINNFMKEMGIENLQSQTSQNKYIEGKVYRDKQGNKAVYRNRQFVPLQQ